MFLDSMVREHGQKYKTVHVEKIKLSARCDTIARLCTSQIILS